jgi:hypothetical protein
MHAMAWVAGGGRPLFGLRLETLQPWTTTAIGDLAGRENLSYDETLKVLLEQLGGYGKAIRRALRPDRTRPARSRTTEQLRKGGEIALKELSSPKEFAIPELLQPVLGKLQALCNDLISAYYVQEVITLCVSSGVLGGALVDGCDAAALVRAMVLTGMAEPLPFREGSAEDGREYRVNPLAAAAWSTVQTWRTSRIFIRMR